MTRPGGKADRRIRRALRAGDVLARLPDGAYLLVRAGLEIDAEHGRVLLSKPFGGGRLRSSGDGLPNMDAPTQTWSWQPSPRPRPQYVGSMHPAAGAAP